MLCSLLSGSVAMGILSVAARLYQERGAGHGSDGPGSRMSVHDDQGTVAFGSMWSVPFLPIFFSLACAPEPVENDSLERLCRSGDLDRPLGHLISTAPAH